MARFPVQEDSEIYFTGYDNLPRFISYYYQTHLALGTGAVNALEVGVGNGTTSEYLRRCGMDVTTCDFDAALIPDVVADIRSLPFDDGSFDLVMAFEVLEHIPWKDALKGISEIARVTKRHVLVSVPYSRTPFEITLKFPFVEAVSGGRAYLDVFLGIPHFWREARFERTHYWEMGRKGYPAARVRKALRRHFTIRKEVRPVMNPAHHFFVLRKR